MKRVILLLAMLALTGCAELAPIAESPNTFAACKAVDVAATAYALHAGGFVEKNALVAPLLSHGYIPLIAVSVALWWIIDRMNTPALTVTANAITCPVAAHNAWLLLK